MGAICIIFYMDNSKNCSTQQRRVDTQCTYHVLTCRVRKTTLVEHCLSTDTLFTLPGQGSQSPLSKAYAEFLLFGTLFMRHLQSLGLWQVGASNSSLRCKTGSAGDTYMEGVKSGVTVGELNRRKCATTEMRTQWKLRWCWREVSSSHPLATPFEKARGPVLRTRFVFWPLRSCWCPTLGNELGNRCLGGCPKMASWSTGQNTPRCTNAQTAMCTNLSLCL